MNIEELLITLKMLGYRIANIDWKHEQCIYFEVLVASDSDERIVFDMKLIFKENENLEYKCGFILDRYCILVYNKNLLE